VQKVVGKELLDDKALDQNACMDFAEALIFPNTGLVIANINSTGLPFQRWERRNTPIQRVLPPRAQATKAIKFSSYIV
jgi:hypothetical protein